MGELGNKNRERAKRVYSEKALMRRDVRKMLLDGLKQATKVQCYDRTTLKVTGNLRRSIFSQSGPENIDVGYKGSIAPYNIIRVTMTGNSVADGHDKEMHPAEFIRYVYGDKIHIRCRGALKNILDYTSRRNF